ncbi:MAG: MopE-related protein [Pseudomonadota bacterium]|nr:MopE-related protein [Pseudomonadota bacterium]
MRLFPLFLAALFVGCDGPDKDTGDTDTDPQITSDVDGDGYTEETGDCDDDNATVYPGADEVYYDGVDQDCDAKDDYDQDEDGYVQEEDCDDENADLSPGADDVCDGIDNNCDGLIDDGGEFTAYLDADADGFGTGDALGTYCELPVGTASNDEDCDDTDPALSPLAAEVCDEVDNNCDGEIDNDATDGRTVYTDSDGDGFGDAATGTAVCSDLEGTVEDATDCDDTDGLTFPGATELCDLEDNNCDGSIDEGAPEARTYYADADLDGYGDPAVSLAECGAPAGYVEAGTDCDDTNASLSPGVDEVCDGIDNNCDGGVDIDPVDGIALYVDADTDGYGDDGSLVLSCEGVSGYVDMGGDCNDADAGSNPGAVELCDTVDNNCDSVTDESTAADAPTWYIDADVDGYGDPSGTAPSCDQPVGFVAADTDCNDTDATVNPAAIEICDGFDQDCDGTVDDDAGDAGTYYADNDGDGYGDTLAAADSCDVPAGYVADDTDCNDADAATYPGAAETCDDQDQDCDGAVDNDPTDGVNVYADTDGDGYGDIGSTAYTCGEGDGYVLDATDCDDSDLDVNPSADETCDNLDNDCDGTIDSADATDATAWYADNDGDSYGDASTGTTACDAPADTVADATDCDDSAAGTYPGAAETCDEADQDCDGTVDDNATDFGTYYADYDGDGFGDAGSETEACDAPADTVTNATDCNDASAAAYPGATESCDSLDNDCDGSVDEAGATGESTWYLDGDLDGYGVSDTSVVACDAPSGYAGAVEDCDDADATTNPGAAELDDGIDNDCDASVDEDFIAEGDVIITEITRQPRFGATSTNTNGQWFELYNASSTDIDLSNWYIQRYSSSLAADGFYVDPADAVVIAAGDYAVFCKTDNFVTTTNAYSFMEPCDYYWGDETASSSYAGTYRDNTFNLQRDTDQLSIYMDGNASTGVLIDDVSWTYTAADGYWPRDASRSMQLDPASYDGTLNDSVDAWCSTTNNAYFDWYLASATSREFGTPAVVGHTCP